jgi:hypothetical protein
MNSTPAPPDVTVGVLGTDSLTVMLEDSASTTYGN